MADFGTEPTPERPADDARERRVEVERIRRAAQHFWFDHRIELPQPTESV